MSDQSLSMNNLYSDEIANQYKNSMSANAIPDIDELLEHVDELFKFVETNNMLKLEKENKQEFESKIYAKFNTKLPMKMIGLFVEKNRYENLDSVLDMLDTLRDIKNGKKDINEEHEKFTNKQTEKYLYPPFGGKEKFEKAMKQKGN